MAGDTDMKYVVCPLDGDQTTPYLSAVASNADLGTMLLALANEGDPFWAFQSLPSDILNANDIGAKWDGAPTVNSDAQTNRNNVAGLFASPPAVGDTNDGTNVVWKVD
jgi:hypothetical protein